MSSTLSARGLLVRGLLVLGVVGGGLWVATQGIAGVKPPAVEDVLEAVTPFRLLMLAGVWLAGLGIYSLVLSAAMPGLGPRRGLLLNLSGSAVANVIPLGGAVATALNWRMLRRWGHSNGAFVAFTVLTNALDVLAKLALPVVAAAALVMLSIQVPEVLEIASAVCGAAILAFLVVHLWSVHGPAPAEAGQGSGWRARVAGLQVRLRASGRRIDLVLRRRWPVLLGGSVGYVAAQVLLLALSLRAVGLTVPVTTLLVAAAIERLGTIVPITPGGAGVAEIGTIAWLVASGLDPTSVVAGVLLYRVFLVAMEIPVGGALLGGWAWLQRRTRPLPGAAS